MLDIWAGCGIPLFPCLFSASHSALSLSVVNNMISGISSIPSPAAAERQLYTYRTTPRLISRGEHTRIDYTRSELSNPERKQTQSGADQYRTIHRLVISGLTFPSHSVVHHLFSTYTPDLASGRSLISQSIFKALCIVVM